MIQVDIKDFISKARALIVKDKRTSLERGARKRPKIDFLNSISETVILLLDNLFSVSDQVFLINSIDKRFCVSDTTYSKFLSENLTNEYARFRKNRIFASNVHKIKDAIALYPVSPKIQFSAIFGDEESVSFEDYEFFIENYYLKSAKEFLESTPVKKLSSKKKELVFDGEVLRPTEVISPASTFVDVIQSTENKDTPLKKNRNGAIKAQKENKVKTPIEKSISPEGSLNKVLDSSVSSRNSESENNFSVYLNNKERDKLRDKDGHLRITLKSGADVNELRTLFDIVKEKDKFPQEIMNSKFLYADYNSSSLLLNEEFVYLRDIDLIHFADPESYGLTNGLLFVCGTEYSGGTGYMLYRYHEGKVYFIENLKFPRGNTTFLGSIRSWDNNNIDGDFAEFIQDYLTIKNEKIGE